MQKKCPRCGLEFELNAENFARNKSASSGFSPYCRPCHNRNGRESVDRKGGTRDYHLRRRYGVTDAELVIMAGRQHGLCAICGDKLNFENRTAHADHDHKKGGVRGLLCSSCNQGLGNFKDSVDRLMAAATYLMAQENVLGEILEAKGG